MKSSQPTLSDTPFVDARESPLHVDVRHTLAIPTRSMLPKLRDIQFTLYSGSRHTYITPTPTKMHSQELGDGQNGTKTEPAQYVSKSYASGYFPNATNFSYVYVNSEVPFLGFWISE